MRRLDLITEVGSPVLAGLILASSPEGQPLQGLWIIALWNGISFFVEVFLLKSIFQGFPNLSTQPISKNLKSISLLKKIKEGWFSTFKHPTFYLIVASALLWLSALSPTEYCLLVT